MSVFSILDNIDRILNRRLQESMVFITPFAILIAISSPIFFIRLYQTEKLWLDGGMVLMSISILVLKYVPYFKQRYLSICWFILLIYCFPLNFTYGLLSQINNIIYYLGEMMMFITIIIIVLDPLILLLILSVGIYAAFVIFSHSPLHLQLSSQLIDKLPIYVSSVILVGVLVRKIRQSINSGVKKQILLNEQTRALQSFGASFAHELRTPLMVIHNLALSHHHIITPMEKQVSGNKLGKIERYSTLINRQSAMISRFVNRHLLNFKAMQAQTEKRMIIHRKHRLSMNTCIERCLALPDFKQALQKRQLIWYKAEDINFCGEAILVEYCLESVLKVSLAMLSMGNVQISLEKLSTQSQLIIACHGTAVSIIKLQSQLNQFFSEYNQGIGLAFCRWAMESMCGDIFCESEHGKNTRFILSFPIETA